MTGTSRSSEGLDLRRRRALFRAWHRGTREMDLILGRFADTWIEKLSVPELAALEALMEVPDADLYAWITGEETTPSEHATDLLARLRAFHLPSMDP